MLLHHKSGRPMLIFFRDHCGLSLTMLVATALATASCITPFAIDSFKNHTLCYFAAEIQSTAKGQASLYLNADERSPGKLCATKIILEDDQARSYRFILPNGPIRVLTLQPLSVEGVVTIIAPRIVTKGGKIIRNLPARDFTVAAVVGHPVKTAGSIKSSVTADSRLDISISPTVEIRPDFIGAVIGILVRFVSAYAVILTVIGVAFYAAHRCPLVTLRHGIKQVVGYFSRHPTTSILVMGAVAVILNCYPVVFLGRSFVSPGLGTVLLYERYPTLPGYTDTVSEDGRGSDVGAMMWQDVPYSAVQFRALRDFELPLWNRFNACGVMLYAQGQSMFGDPLHFIPVAARGAAWAWDLKFLLAKWLLACGVGLIVWHSTRHRPATLLITAVVPFVGFFFYRLNHPSFFSFCYAPWILYAWLRLTQAATLKQAVGHAAVLLLASWVQMASGAVKEAYMLVVLMNLVGLIVLLCAKIDPRTKGTKLALAAWTGCLLGLLSSPMWLTLFDTLRTCYSDYENSQSISQIHPAMILGLFDEYFFRSLGSDGNIVYPSANFLILTGVAYALATFEQGCRQLKAALSIATLLLISAAFTIIPAAWLARVPYLAGVQATDSRFCLVLIIALSALAGLGFQTMLSPDRDRLERRRPTLAALLLVLPALVFVLAARGMFSGLQLHTTLETWLVLVTLLGAALGYLATAHFSARAGRWSYGRTAIATVCAVIMLIRFGQHARFEFLQPYVYHPAARVDFLARSPAIETIRSDRKEPFRVIGIEGNFFAGWTGMYGLESLSGPDGFSIRSMRELLAACGLDRQWSWRIVAHGGNLDDLKHSYDFFNVKYFFDAPQLRLKVRTISLIQHADLDVYRNDTPWPRAFFTDRLWIYQDLPQLGEAVVHGDGLPFAAMAADQRPPTPVPVASNLDGRMVVPASGYRLTANTTSFQVNAPGAGIIVLQEPWLEGDFRVRVNGHEASYLRINHAFKGVYVDAPGTYQVSFSYCPQHFRLALILATIGLVLGMATWGILRRFDRPWDLLVPN
jgi:hypothetical protein